VKALNSDYKSAVKLIFEQAAFVSNLGIRLVDMGPGWCETELDILPGHFQHHEYVHAGVQATMADHTAGAAATTLVGEHEYVLTAEFKINFLRPARGEQLRCRSQVLKPGRTLIVAESEILAGNREQSTLVAKAMFTLAIVRKANDEQL
jgi:uncharacterized protein (TIGR00369 family)